MKYLVVGLGNIGSEYQNTRHNIGFKVLDAFIEASNLVFTSNRYGAVCEKKIKGRSVIFLKPNTFMNLSGKSVAFWVRKEKIAIEDVLIIVDDIALPFGTLRLKGKGSDGGHNGLKSIIECLESTNFARMRFGLGNDFSKGNQIDYVLGEWTDEESKVMPDLLDQAKDIINAFVMMGISKTMNIYNGKSILKK